MHHKQKKSKPHMIKSNWCTKNIKEDLQTLVLGYYQHKKPSIFLHSIPFLIKTTIFSAQYLAGFTQWSHKTHQETKK